ncbi:hypothetical protein SLS62_006031 [Diatrype stigma]|uniref:Tautomerase cis-CaaD-like domain-containing protein n=1 Tax=Diatrype stigma TaxID=117547 RepID=A0AAN9UTY1_9PEZI
MPLWEIFHTANAFSTPQSKALLAKDITAWYTSAGLPAFYVNVLFRPMAGEDMWIGGKPAAAFPGDPAALERPFVRLSIQHLAYRNSDEKAMTAMCDRIDKWLSPHLEKYDWEYNISEPARDLWRINGIIPPPFGSALEKKWAEEEKPSKYY